jgi:hypothetical protein
MHTIQVNYNTNLEIDNAKRGNYYAGVLKDGKLGVER